MIKKLLFLVFTLFFIWLIYLIFSSYSATRLHFFELPASSTVVAIEIKPPATELISHTGSITAYKLFNLEKYFNFDQNFHNKYLQLTVPIATLHSKIYSIHSTDTFYPLIIFNFKEQIPEKLITQLHKVHLPYFKTKNQLYLSSSSAFLQEFLTKPKGKLRNNLDTQQLFANLPKQTLLHLYFNHNLINSPHSLNQILNLTGASLTASPQGLLLSTYTTPQPNFTFPYTKNKYRPVLPNILPSDIDFYYGTANIANRIIKNLKNLSQFQNDDTLLAQTIYNFLSSLNLSKNAFYLLLEIFNNEFAFFITTNNQQAVVAQLTPPSEILLTQELDNYAAFLNPIKESFKLPDDTTAYRLVPDSSKTYHDLQPKIFQKHFQNYTILTTDQHFQAIEEDTENPQNPQNPSLAQDKFFSQGLSLLFPIADQIIFMRSNYLYQFLSHTLEHRDIPNIFSASNFFHDGFQTVTLLQW